MDVQHLPPPPPVPREYIEAKRWVQGHMAQLVEQHPDQWVAVLDGKVIAAAPGLDAVEERLAREHHGRSPFVRLIEGTPGVYAHRALA